MRDVVDRMGHSKVVQLRSLLTADDLRSVGFRPDPASETVDDQVAHVWYRSARQRERWDVGLGLYDAPHIGAADRYWDGLVAELAGGDAGVEAVAVGDQAVYVEGWLYLRHGGHVLWIAAEGPDPLLARRTVERLARAVCPRVSPLPPEPSPTAAPVPAPTGSPDQSSVASPGEPSAGSQGGSSAGSQGGSSAGSQGGSSAGTPAGPSSARSEVPSSSSDTERAVPEKPSAESPGPLASADAADSGGRGPAGEDAAGTGDASGARGPVLRPRATAPGRYPRRHLANAALAVVGDALVVTDARGRERHLTLDGTPDAPAAIGLTVDPRHALGTSSAYLAVVDGNGRLLVRDGEVGAWALDDVRHFADEAGLGYMEPGTRVPDIDWSRQPIEMEGTPWAFILLVVVAVPAAVVLGVVGLPGPVALAVAAVLVVVVLGMSWRSRVRVTTVEPAP